MPLLRETKIYKTFVISVSLTIALVLSGIFLGMSIRTRQLIFDSSLAQARALFHSIVLARKWNALFNGVYVEKKEGVQSNPYLENPDITATDGRIFTKKNPALMTREISELAKNGDSFAFRITSLNPLNPHNKPDDFEADALKMFEGGKEEAFKISVLNEKPYFRYMAPLYVEESCLKCHAKQGYKKGQIRGGISVTFDVNNLQRKLTENTFLILVFGVTTTGLLLGLIYVFTSRLIQRVSDARTEIERMAITDGLTDIFNRRHLLERFEEERERARRNNSQLGCILLDIDHFKQINDTFGHQIGDKVIIEIAKILKDSIRAYDVLGRYGGEEFLIAMPDADIQSTIQLAERMRDNVKKSPILGTPVTISAGVSNYKASDETIEQIIRRADHGLYKAKHSGRDRVEHSED
ncbi:MAG: diguanylate cyclase [Nitrospirae bacterium]|nr:diguanylate cyclase [Nitrospirota bacterium]